MLRKSRLSRFHRDVSSGRATEIIVDFKINETLPVGEVGNLTYRGAKAVRKPNLPFFRLVGTVFNSADAVRLETAPTGLN